MYNGLKYAIQDSDFWLTYLYLNVVAPYYSMNSYLYPGGEHQHNQHFHYPIRLPLLRKVKKIPNLSLTCLKNLLSLDDHFLFLAMLIDFELEFKKNLSEILCNTSCMLDICLEDKVKAAEESVISQCHLQFSLPVAHYLVSLMSTCNLSSCIPKSNP